MKPKILFTALFVVGLSGCATPVPQIDYYDVDTATLKNIKPIEVIDEQALAAGDFKELGTVKGFHCRRAQGIGTYGADKADAERTAIDQLRLRAASKSASHITAPQCTINDTMDLVNNCWASMTCTSSALQQRGDVT